MVCFEVVWCTQKTASGEVFQHGRLCAKFPGTGGRRAKVVVRTAPCVRSCEACCAVVVARTVCLCELAKRRCGTLSHPRKVVPGLRTKS